MTLATYPNWFVAGGAQEAFARHLLHLDGRPAEALQIGAFTGDASVWLLDHALTHPDSRLHDVDTWEGSGEPEHEAFDWDDVERTYSTRMNAYAPERVQEYQTTSDHFFQHCQTMTFDFIYIDGDHHALQVLRDGVNAVPRLKPGGLVAFDDYQWGAGLPTLDRPRAAIHAVIDLFVDVAEVVEMGLQVWLRKL